MHILRNEELPMTDTNSTKNLQRAFNPMIKQWDLITKVTPDTITFYSGNTIDAKDVTIISE